MMTKSRRGKNGGYARGRNPASFATRIRKGQTPAKEVPPEPPELEEWKDMPDFLREMRWVMAHAETCWDDSNPWRSLARAMQRERPWEFGKELIRMMEDWEKRQAPTVPVVNEPDVGLERVIEVLREVMKEEGLEVPEEDAEFAKRPDAAEKGASLLKMLKASQEREAHLQKELEELRRLSGRGTATRQPG